MKIHFLSNSLKTNSGFAIVTKNLAQELRKLGHTITMSGMQTSVTPEYTYGIKSYPIPSFIDEGTQFRENLMNVDPDVVIYVGEMYTDLCQLAKIFPRTIAYPPVEDLGIPRHMIYDLNTVVNNGGRVIAQCSYGFNEMVRHDVQATGYIYHGYNEKIFKPLEKSELIRRYCFYSTEVGKESNDPRRMFGCYDCALPVSEHVFCPKFKDELITICKYKNNKWTEIPDLPIYQLKNEFNNKFVYLLVGQNHRLRKKIDRLLMAFSLLLDSQQMKDKLHLHLHTQPQSNTGINLLALASKLGIQENVSFSYGDFRSSGWSEEAICRLYNVADVAVTASSSEGFGLPILESMACGIPQVTPDCTSMTELVGKDQSTTMKITTDQRGLLAKIGDSDLISAEITRQLVDISDLSTKMKEMYTNKELREKCSENCLEFVKPYTWNQLAVKWDKLITELVKQNQ